ncbi:Uncharacterised protein r2_g536 [Pycnogonum litorale]
MQGPYKGVATRLQEDAPMATNIYCGAHGSNLVNKACSRSSVAAVDIYGTDNKPGDLQKVKTFLYGNARKRNQIFENVKKNADKSLQNLELAGTHTIRLCSLHDATDRILKLYPVVLQTMLEIKGDMNFDATVRATANGLSVRFNSFETLVTLNLFQEIFGILGPLNKILQSRNIDLSITISAVDSAAGRLQELRDTQGVEIIRHASEMAAQLNMENTDFKVKRIRKKKRLTQEEGADERISDSKQQWLTEVFCTSIDIAMGVLDEKFQRQRASLLSMDAFLPHNFYKGHTEEDIRSLVWKLGFNVKEVSKELYDFAKICAAHKAYILKQESSSFKSVYVFLLTMNLESVFPSLYNLYKILSTIPTSSVECERIFSKMKIIKNRLSNRLTAENLENRIVLAMEHDLMWNLRHEEIIRRYANTKELKRVLYP